MSPEYKDLRSKADRLYMRFNDVVDDKNAVAGLAGDIRNIVEDLEMSKSPRSVDDRIKRVIEELKSLRRGDGASMDFGDVEDLIDQYEDLRSDVRDLDNY